VVGPSLTRKTLNAREPRERIRYGRCAGWRPPVSAEVRMTIFGWDASHYDGSLNKTILARAKAEGIVFFTHKIGEGLSNTDTTAQAALNAARDVGMQVVGGYYFIHSGDMVAQATRCIALADRYVPWWRTFGGWFWQTDAETDTGGHLPSPSEVKQFSDTLANRTRKTVIVYASHGQYGNRLLGLGHPLWNANYPSDRKGGFKALYPGDHYAGWDPYSGQTPVIAQYTSSATIAGLTTCDANAYRGTLDQLLALIGGHSTGDDNVTPAEFAHILQDPAVAAQMRALPWQYDGRGIPENLTTLGVLNDIYTNTLDDVSLSAKVDALAANVDALSAKLDQVIAVLGGGSTTLPQARGGGV
jgi:GH25 family lysozyme M1 (1,4-beta-N-acetylmuramidase)